MKHLQIIGYNNLEYDERRNMPADKEGELYRSTRTGNAYLVNGSRAFSLSPLLGGWQDIEEVIAKENKPQQQKVMAALILVLLFM